jgi:hypothetical protein
MKGEGFQDSGLGAGPIASGNGRADGQQHGVAPLLDLHEWQPA